MDIVQNPPAESAVPTLLNTAQAAAFLCIGKSTFQFGVKTGKYPPGLYVSQRRPVWDVTSLAAFVKTL
jgi:hypothetical protein